MLNPIRRNKNTGKTQGGRVRDGKPEEKESRAFPVDHLWRTLTYNGRSWQLFRENPSREFYHPCAPEEYAAVLERMPAELTRYVAAIALRRTSREDARRGIDARRRAGCVLMNAFPVSNVTPWAARPDDASVRHLAPWCDRWRSDGGTWRLVWEPQEVRRYYLYHVFLHEVGHINQPAFHALRRRESFAENFALEWARTLGEL